MELEKISFSDMQNLKTVNTLTVDYQYSLLNKDNLTQPIQMILPEEKNFSHVLFFCILETSIKFWTFSKKTLLSLLMYFRSYGLRKTRLDKCLKSTASEDPSTSNIVNGPNHCWNLNDGGFIIFIDHCSGNWLGKSFSPWYRKC